MITDMRAPMAAAPMKFRPDGDVDWGSMWDTFCGLAQAGGPPHRGEMLYGQPDSDPNSEAYQRAVGEIVRGVREVSGLAASPATTGWIAVHCHSVGMAAWLQDAILDENIHARAEGQDLWIPVGEHFTLKGEIKSVITVVAKTTHYWNAHLSAEVKNTLEVETQLARWKYRLLSWLHHPSPRASGG